MSNEPKISKRYFNNRYSRKDFNEFVSQMTYSTINHSQENELQEHWTEICNKDVPDADLSSVLSTLHHRIKFRDARKSSTQRMFIMLQRIAAILFVPLFIATLFLINSSRNTEQGWAEIHCPPAVRTKFQLPDGSTGWLNSGSTLEYPLHFSKNRQVKLSGEAFFDIMHNKEYPFHVLTSSLDIKVLGTQFNVSSYSDLEHEQITLQQGSVEILSSSQAKLAILSPGEQLTFNHSTGQYQKGSVELSQFIAWTKGKLVFKDEQFDIVAKRLGLWYNAEIQIKDKKLNDYIFYGTFQNETLEEALSRIQLTAPISYDIQPRTKDANGDYEPTRVIISLK